MLRTSARFVRLGLLFRLTADQLPTRRRRRTLVVVVARHPAQARVVSAELAERRRAGNAVRQVVVSVRGVVNRILAGARHAALETDDLRDQAVVLRQHDAAAVQQRQQVAVEVGLGLLRDACGTAP